MTSSCKSAIENADSDLKVNALRYANELLVRVSFPFENCCKLAQHAGAIRKGIVWEKSNEAYPLSIRVQVQVPFFHPNLNLVHVLQAEI